MNARQLARELHKLFEEAQKQPGWFTKVDHGLYDPLEDFAREFIELDESTGTCLKYALTEAREAKNFRL